LEWKARAAGNAQKKENNIIKKLVFGLKATSHQQPATE
jgi:hypothetical protein